MTQAIKVLIITGCSYYAAYFVLSRLTIFGSQLWRYVIGCMIILAASTLSRSILIGYLAAAFVAYFLARGYDASSKIALFFGLAFALSDTIGFFINPGVDLGALNLPRVLSITLLVPIILFSPPDKKIRRLNILDKVMLFLFIWIFLIDLRHGIGLGTFRVILWNLIDYIIPYFVIRMYLREYGLVFTAIAFSLLAQAMVGAFESILTWHIYTDVEMLANFADPVLAAYKIRGAFLRAQASFMNPLIFSMFTNMSCLCMVIIARKIGMDAPASHTKLFAGGGVCMAVLGILSTGSRAGIAGGIMIILLMSVLLWAIARKRDPKKMLVLGGLAALVALFTVGGDVIRENFAYRSRLFEQSMSVILSNPLAGIPDIYQDPRMLVMMQGEGIIDMVNTYLIFGVYYGLPGLLSFIFLLFYGMSALYDGLRNTEGEKLTFGIFCFTSLLVMAFNIATTSAFGWQYTWIWLSLAISSNIVARIKSDLREARGDAPLL